MPRSRAPQVEVVAKDDDGSLIGRQPPENPIEQLTVGREDRGVVDRGPVGRRQRDLDRPSSTTPQDVDAGSSDEAAQPAFETIRVTQGGQAPPRPDEAVLDRIPREVGVPDDESGCRVQPRDERAGENGEGVMIAPLRPFDEFSLVHDPPDFVVGAAVSSRSDGSRH